MGAKDQTTRIANGRELRLMGPQVAIAWDVIEDRGKPKRIDNKPYIVLLDGNDNLVCPPGGLDIELALQIAENLKQAADYVYEQLHADVDAG